MQEVCRFRSLVKGSRGESGTLNKPSSQQVRTVLEGLARAAAEGLEGDAAAADSPGGKRPAFEAAEVPIGVPDGVPVGVPVGVLNGVPDGVPIAIG
jgi:hypothetical protein